MGHELTFDRSSLYLDPNLSFLSELPTPSSSWHRKIISTLYSPQSFPFLRFSHPSFYFILRAHHVSTVLHIQTVTRGYQFILSLSHSHSLSLALSLSLSLSFSLPISHSHAIWHSKVYIYYSPSPLCLLFGLSSNDRHFLDVERTKQPQVLLPLNRKSAAIDTGHQKIDLKKFCLITDSETRYSITIATMKLPDGKTSLGMEMKYVFLLLA